MAWYQAVALSYPGQTHADGLMLLPSEKEEPSSVLPENGTALDLVLEGDMVLPVTGLVENGTAMVPVAAVAQALGYQVIYTPGEDGEGDRIAVESDQFSVPLSGHGASSARMWARSPACGAGMAGRKSFAPGAATMSSETPPRRSRGVRSSRTLVTARRGST